jgi:hypothetical protein
MSYPHSKFKLLHLGAENCVTGSCHLLQANGLVTVVYALCLISLSEIKPKLCVAGAPGQAWCDLLTERSQL